MNSYAPNPLDITAKFPVWNMRSSTKFFIRSQTSQAKRKKQTICVESQNVWFVFPLNLQHSQSQINLNHKTLKNNLI